MWVPPMAECAMSPCRYIFPAAATLTRNLAFRRGNHKIVSPYQGYHTEGRANQLPYEDIARDGFCALFLACCREGPLFRNISRYPQVFDVNGCGYRSPGRHPASMPPFMATGDGRSNPAYPLLAVKPKCKAQPPMEDALELGRAMLRPQPSS